MPALANLLRSGSSRATAETLEATRAVKNIAEALTSDRAISPDDVRTADRVLRAPVAWESLLRKAPAARKIGQ